MTDISTEAVVAPAATDTAPAPASAQAVDAADEQKNSQVEDVPGGWPVAPLALSGANATVSTIAAAGLAGGPIAAAVAATGMAVLGTLASYRSRNPRPKRAARRAAARTAARQQATRHRSGGLNTAGRKTGSGGGRTAGGSGKVPGQKRRGPGAGSGRGAAGQGGSGAGKHRAPVSLNKPAGLKNGRGGEAGFLSKAGQVTALRKAQKQAGASRAQKREQTSAARRAVADARRNTPKPNKPKASANKPGAGKARARSGGLAGRMLGGAGRKARAVKQAAIAKQRARRDAATARKVSGGRQAARKAPARQAARKALRRSATRFHGRRALAALLALPIGLLGFLTSPLGRKLRLPWLVHPGRRLYARLTGAARHQRAECDAAIRHEQAAAEQEATQDVTDRPGNQVQRPAGPVPNTTDHTSTSSEGEHVSGFRFEEHAAEMEQAAQAYDPEDAMEILTMVESLPAALTSVANVMKILAERADSEFPLEKEVADGFNDIFGALNSAVAVAEDMGPLFRQAHEHDIARHEDPRNGPEAEKGWNV
ncbi:hypothetical protein ACFVZT_23570 [Streptomyces sp. NPDC058321]|uniref:hypothetical protein n=1 Tax=Streptomyces sp. NPDC058321 TaxID=3346445 RepID=UPI0036ED7B21